jgi:hypothetical protein
MTLSKALVLHSPVNLSWVAKALPKALLLHCTVTCPSGRAALKCPDFALSCNLSMVAKTLSKALPLHYLANLSWVAKPSQPRSRAASGINGSFIAYHPGHNTDRQLAP